MAFTLYLTCDNVQLINEGFVGPDMLRDFGLLDSAVARPQASAFGADAYPTLHEKAATLLYGLARNHPFVDANKNGVGRDIRVLSDQRLQARGRRRRRRCPRSRRCRGAD